MSLESLRKLRAQAVETLMMELAQIARALAQSEEQCRDIESHVQEDVALYDRQAAGGMTIETWLEWQGRMEAQQATLRRVRREMDQAFEAWRRTQALLVEARQERKLLDLVADKRREVRRADERRREQRMTDDAANRGYTTGKKSPS